MAFKVDDFVSHFASHKDFSKASRFQASIFLPQSLKGIIPDSRDLSLQCETAELPGYNINTVDGRVYGPTYPVATYPVYQDLNLTFICAGDMWEKKLFDDWMFFIVPQTDFLSRYRDEYIGQIEVKQYLEIAKDETLTEPQLAYHVRFNDAFPTSIAPITLNWGDDQINKLNVTIKYRGWERIPLPGEAGPTALAARNTLTTAASNLFRNLFNV